MCSRSAERQRGTGAIGVASREWPKQWRQGEWARLAQHVDTDIETTLSPLPSFYDLRSAGRLRDVTQKIYDLLLGMGFEYEQSRTNYQSQEDQQVRSAAEAHDGKKGNCLELALVFAAYCLEARLRPLLVILGEYGGRLEGHVVVAVWLGGESGAVLHGKNPMVPREDYRFSSAGVLNVGDGAEKARTEFAGRLEMVRGGYEQPAPAGGGFLLVDCTGFTRSGAMNPPEGTLTFEQACIRGRQEFDRRKLVNLVDLAYCLHRWGDGRGRAWQPESDHLTGWSLERLNKALARLDPPLDASPAWDHAGLLALRDELSRQPSSPATQKATWLAVNLAHALDAVMFIRDWLPTLERAALWHAATAALAGTAGPPLPGTAGAASTTSSGTGVDLDVVARVALQYPARSGQDCGRTLVTFVILLACETRTNLTEADLAADGRFRAWAERMVSWLDVNELCRTVVEGWQADIQRR